jgi:ComF family protein
MSRAESGLVCGVCWSRIAALPRLICERCGHPRSGVSCRWCELLPAFVRSARSVCWVPGEPAGEIVHALKYGGWHSVADEMALRMSRLSFPADVAAERAALVPVPLSRSRLKERGYNQSALLAEAISRAWRIPVWDDCLERTRSTGTQTELSPEERRANVAGSVRFHTRRAEVDGAHLVVVDDVVTTAATLNECARALYDAGARIISYVTFGRARSAGDRI